jgi:hypothetical protein
MYDEIRKRKKSTLVGLPKSTRDSMWQEWASERPTSDEIVQRIEQLKIIQREMRKYGKAGKMAERYYIFGEEQVSIAKDFGLSHPRISQMIGDVRRGLIDSLGAS